MKCNCLSIGSCLATRSHLRVCWIVFPLCWLLLVQLFVNFERIFFCLKTVWFRHLCISKTDEQLHCVYHLAVVCPMPDVRILNAINFCVRFVIFLTKSLKYHYQVKECIFFKWLPLTMLNCIFVVIKLSHSLWDFISCRPDLYLNYSNCSLSDPNSENIILMVN